MQACNRLTFVEDLTIYHALEQKQALMTALEEGGAIELDLSQVGEIDTAGLQLLILARQEAARFGKPMTILAASRAVMEAFEFCNLVAFFGGAAVAACPNRSED